MWIPNFAAADPKRTCCRRAGRCSSRLRGDEGEHQRRRPLREGSAEGMARSWRPRQPPALLSLGPCTPAPGRAAAGCHLSPAVLRGGTATGTVPGSQRCPFPSLRHSAALAAGLAPSPLSSAPRAPRLPLLPSPGPRGGERPRGLALPGCRRGPAGSAPPPPAGQGTVAWRACRGSCCCCCCCWGFSTFSCPLRFPSSAAHNTHTLAGLGVGGLRILSARPPAPSRLLRPIITNLGEKAAASPPLSHTKALSLGDKPGDSPRGTHRPYEPSPGGCGHGVCPPRPHSGQPSGGEGSPSRAPNKQKGQNVPSPALPSQNEEPAARSFPPGAAPVPLIHTQRHALQGKRFPLALRQLLFQLPTALPLDLGHVTLHSCVKFKGGISCFWGATVHN